MFFKSILIELDILTNTGFDDQFPSESIVKVRDCLSRVPSVQWELPQFAQKWVFELLHPIFQKLISTIINFIPVWLKSFSCFQSMIQITHSPSNSNVMKTTIHSHSSKLITTVFSKCFVNGLLMVVMRLDLVMVLIFKLSLWLDQNVLVCWDDYNLFQSYLNMWFDLLCFDHIWYFQ